MSKTQESKTQEPLAFEDALKELQNIVQELEQGPLSLEQALARFERGVELTRSASDLLKKAEQKVDLLIKKYDTLETEPFEIENEAT